MSLLRNTINKLNSNICDEKNNKKARRTRSALRVVGGVFTLLGVLGIVASVILFGIGASKSTRELFYANNFENPGMNEYTSSGLILLLTCGILMVIGIILLIYSSKIVVLDIASKVINMKSNVIGEKHFCSYCGSEIPKGEYKCSSCGAPLHSKKE